MSNEHFTVDGTLIEAWASMKGFRTKGENTSDRPIDWDPGNPTVDFRGEKRSNKTRESKTDPERRLMRKAKGKEAILCFSGHAPMENRNGLLIDLKASTATGTAEEEAAEQMLSGRRAKTSNQEPLGADKGYYTTQFVDMLRSGKSVRHSDADVAGRGGSAIDGRTTRHR